MEKKTEPKKSSDWNNLLERIDSLESILQETLVYTKFANLTKLRETLDKELNTEEKKLAFENTNGTNGLKELSVISGAPEDTIYSWWQRWLRLGLVKEGQKHKGRMTKIIALDDIGIKIPKKAKQHAEPSTQVEETPV